MPKKQRHFHGKTLLRDFRAALIDHNHRNICWYLDKCALELTENETTVHDIFFALNLIKDNYGIDRCHHYENVLLNPAIINDNLALIESLCEGGCIHPDTIGNDGLSALERATNLGNAQVVGLLLKTPYSLEDDPSEIVAKSYDIALRTKNAACLPYLTTAFLYKLIKNNNVAGIQAILKDLPFDPFFKDCDGNTPLHIAISFVADDTFSTILSYFYHALSTKNIKNETPIEVINELITNPDLKELYQSNYRNLLYFIAEKVHYLDSCIIQQQHVNDSMQELMWFLSIFRKLSTPLAETIKGQLIVGCQSEPVRKELHTSSNLNVDYVPDGPEKIYLLQQQQVFIDNLLNLNNDGINACIQEGVNPNFHLDDGETPLTHAVRSARVDIVHTLMQSNSIEPHLPNLFGETPVFLAFSTNNVPCFASIMMEVKTPICETREYAIEFPGKGWVDIDLDNNEQVEMWEGLSKSNYMEKEYNVVRKTFLSGIVNLKGFLQEQFEALQDEYSDVQQLATSSIDNKPLEDADGYFLTIHKNTRFLDAPDKRGERECQSAVLSLQGCPVGVFSHSLSSPRGAAIAYRIDPSKVLTTAKGDMNSVRLWIDHASTHNGREFETNPERAIKVLDETLKRPGASLVRNRWVGGYKQRTFAGLVGKIHEMSGRVGEPFYLSKKDMSKRGGQGIIPRYKVNENYLYYLKNQTLPYNEVLIKTAAMEPGSTAVSDISHIFLAENKGDFSLLSLINAVSTQMELMIHRDSRHYFPICYYDVTNGAHTKLSISSLGFLTKLAEICYVMPIDCLNFNASLKGLIAPIPINVFFTTEHTAIEIKQLILALCSSKYHEDKQLGEILSSGLLYHSSVKANMYYPYLSSRYNEDVYRSYMIFNENLNKVVDDIATSLLQKQLREPSHQFSPLFQALKLAAIKQSIMQQLWDFRCYQCSDISKKGNVVIKKIPELSAWSQFWVEGKKTNLPLDYLWNVLAIFIINCPYEDEPHDVAKYGPSFIYRLNHDVSHAIRKYVMVLDIINLLRDYGRAEIQTTLQSVSCEEYALITLVAFLERCGRTNEESGVDDPSNAIRSMAITKQVAAALGFNETLVNSICKNATNFGTSYEDKGFSGSEDDADLPRKKANLFHQILTLSHHCDLGRCRDNGFKFVESLLTDRELVLGCLVPWGNLKTVVKELMHKVLAHSKDTGTSIRDYKDNFYDLRLKAECVYHTGLMISKLHPNAFMAAQEKLPPDHPSWVSPEHPKH